MKTFIIPEDRIQFMMNALVKYDKDNPNDKHWLRAKAIYIIKEHLEFIDFIGGRVEWSGGNEQQRNKTS